MATTDPALGLRERKNRRTQEAIVRAAAELTLEGGYAAATITRIAERADVAPRTVSTWFPVKDEILFEGTEDHIDRARGYLEGGTGDVVDRIEAWIADEVARERPPFDLELWRLRRDAIEHDPVLRAMGRMHLERLQDAIARTAADGLGVDVSAGRPQLFAGAAIAFFERLATLAPQNADLELAEAEIAAGLAFLRAGYASLVDAGS